MTKDVLDLFEKPGAPHHQFIKTLQSDKPDKFILQPSKCLASDVFKYSFMTSKKCPIKAALPQLRNGMTDDNSSRYYAACTAFANVREDPSPETIALFYKEPFFDIPPCFANNGNLNVPPEDGILRTYETAKVPASDARVQSGRNSCIVFLEAMLKHGFPGSTLGDLFQNILSYLTGLLSSFSKVHIVPLTTCAFLARCALSQQTLTTIETKVAERTYTTANKVPQPMQKYLRHPLFRNSMNMLFKAFFQDYVSADSAIMMESVNEERHFTHALFETIMSVDSASDQSLTGLCNEPNAILVICDDKQTLPFFCSRLLPISKTPTKLRSVFLSLSCNFRESNSYLYSLTALRCLFVSKGKRTKASRAHVVSGKKAVIIHPLSLPVMHLVSGNMLLPYFYHAGSIMFFNQLAEYFKDIALMKELFDSSDNSFYLPGMVRVAKLVESTYLRCVGTDHDRLPLYLKEVHVSFNDWELRISHLPPSFKVLFNHCKRAFFLAAVLFYDVDEIDRQPDNMGFQFADAHFVPEWY